MFVHLGLSAWLSVWLVSSLVIHPSFHSHNCSVIRPFAHLSIVLSIYPTILLSMYLSLYPLVLSSIFLRLCKQSLIVRVIYLLKFITNKLKCARHRKLVLWRFKHLPFIGSFTKFYLQISLVFFFFRFISRSFC